MARLSRKAPGEGQVASRQCVALCWRGGWLSFYGAPGVIAGDNEIRVRVERGQGGQS